MVSENLKKGLGAGFVALVLAASAGAASAASHSDDPAKPVTLPGQISAFTGGKAKVISPYTVIRVGQKLQAQPEGFTPKPKAYTYKWYRDGVEIPSATLKEYKLHEEDIGTRITVKITATKTGYRDTTVKSEPTEIIRELKADTPDDDEALFMRIVGSYTTLSESGDVENILTIARDGSFTYSETALADYSNSVPKGFECPTASCTYQSSQIGRFGGVSIKPNGAFELAVVAASTHNTPGTVLSKGAKNGSVIAISPIVPFAVGQTLTVSPSKDSQVPPEIKRLACEQYSKVCKNGKWTGWTIGNFHSFGN